MTPDPLDLLVTGCTAVTMDDAGTIIEDATIAIADGRIAWIGPAAEATGLKATTTVDGRGRIALPGMIDAHVHTAQQLLRGKLAELSRKQPLRMPPWKNYYIPFEGMLEPEDVHLSGLVAYTNMIMNGTTCFLEAGGPHPDEMARAAEEVGIRGFVSLSTVDRNTDFAGRTVPGSMLMTTQQAYDRNVDLVRRHRKPGKRVQAWLSLRQIIVCTPELTKGLADVARAEGVKIHTHLAEGTYEIDYALEHYGARPTTYLEKIGAIGPHIHAAHSVILMPEEVDLYETHQVSACHCSMGNYGIGIPRLQEMWRRGIPIGLGTDGAASAHTMDIFQVAHAARIGQAAQIGHAYHHRTPMSAEEILKVATRGGARTAGMGDELGALEAGRRADLILLDPSDADSWGAVDPLYIAAHCILGRDVRTVIVDGALVMKEREMLTVDMDRLRAQLATGRARIMARFDAAVAA